VVLSDAERRALRDIEIELLLEDPPLAVALARHRLSWAWPRTRLAYDVVLAVSAAAAILCLVLADAGGIQGGLTSLAFAIVTFAIRVWRFPP
jgi:hypothetical protein